MVSLTYALLACLANLLTYLAVGLVLPALPIYMRAVVGASDFTISVVTASFAFTTLLARPLGGLFGDRFGYRVPALTGCVLVAIGSALTGLAPHAGWLLVCRLLVGLGEGLTQASCIAWALALTPAATRGRVLSYAGVTGWMGFALGATLSAEVTQRFGYRGLWFGAFVSPCLGFLSIVFVPTRKGEGGNLSMWRLVQTLSWPGSAYALVTIGYAAVLAFGALLATSRGEVTHGRIIQCFVVGVISIRLLAGGLPATWGAARAASICALAQAVGLALVAVSPVAEGRWAGAALAGAAFGLAFPSLALDALSRVREGDRGVAIGVVSAFFDVGISVAGPVLGAIATRAGYAGVFWFGSLCAVLAAACGMARAAAPGANETTSSSQD